MPFQNLQLLICWNKLLKMLRKSYRQQFNFQCVFLGLFLNSPLIFYIKTHQIIEQT